MPVKLYLAFNALMYAVFAAWCTLAPRQTGEYVGLTHTTPGGQSEYLAVYGGLQAGLALFYGLALFSAEHQRSALWMSAFLYGGIAAFRTLAALRLGFEPLGNARFFYCAEIALFLAALFLLARRAS
jgi:hypothetical protein